MPFSSCGDLAQPIVFKPDLLESVVESAIPTFEGMKGASTASAFKDLKVRKTKTTTTFSYRQITALPPFIADALLNKGSTNPALLGVLSVAATGTIADLHKEDAEFADLEHVGRFIRGGFWLAANNKLPTSPFALPSSSLTGNWAKSLHDKWILPKSESATDPNMVSSPS